MTETPSRSPRGLLIKLGVVALVLLVGAVLLARGYDVKGLMQRGLEYIRGAGPVAFFTAQAILPAVGAPQLAFTMTAGPAFGPQLGMGWVVCCVVLALTVNMVLGYLLARYLLRPVLAKLVTRLGYKLPEVTPDNAVDVVVLLRVTPGVPFAIQNFVSGLARVPFGKYLLVSILTAGPINAAFVVFGDALLQGKGRTALVVVCIISALVAVTQLVRKHYAKKRT